MKILVFATLALAITPNAYRGSMRNLDLASYQQRPYYVPAELVGMPLGTAIYWGDESYEIHADGYMYKQQ